VLLSLSYSIAGSARLVICRLQIGQAKLHSIIAIQVRHLAREYCNLWGEGGKLLCRIHLALHALAGSASLVNCKLQLQVGQAKLNSIIAKVLGRMACHDFARGRHSTGYRAFLTAGLSFQPADTNPR
jgi:hypothetical protein